MTFADLLGAVIARLDAAGVPYMVTGSLASSYHGEPRATRDVDIAIDPTVDALSSFVDGLVAAGFYVDQAVAREALAQRSQFNAIGPDATLGGRALPTGARVGRLYAGGGSRTSTSRAATPGAVESGAPTVRPGGA